MKKVLTIILDGFGIREEKSGNAIAIANTPNFDTLWETYPHCLLKASEDAVGLPIGQFGNSEVGHSTIGAGHIIKQADTEIDELLMNDNIDQNEAFNEMIEYIEDNEATIHLIGLASDGGVHSNIKFFNDILIKLKKRNIKKVYFHLITDGRDTSPVSSLNFIEYIKSGIKQNGIGSIASICGRYYAMDRDNKWDRTKLYYDAITKGIGYKTNDINTVIENCYKKGITDEFLPPIITDLSGIIKDNDVIFWLNFRSDRAKQILLSLTNSDFKNFATLKYNLKLVCFYKVSNNINSLNLLNDKEISNPLGIYLSKLGLSQARIAETEKYAHVTYFFDGGYNGDIEGCDKYLIPSPKVNTYDKIPEMSALKVMEQTINAIEKDYDFILVNFANPDMVGHTGNLQATIKAIEYIDLCLGKIIEEANSNFYKIVLLSDHGNADLMIDDKNRPVTTHTLSKVPFIITDKKVKLVDGDLTNVAPKILKYMDIALPNEMKKTKSLFYEVEE